MTDPRRCSCGTVLSAYNSDDKCWPCIDHQRAYGAATTSCGIVLSAYNSDDKCFPCIDHQRAYGAATTSATNRPYSSWSNRKTSEQIEQEQAVLMAAIREHTTGPFKVMALKPWLPFEKGLVTQLLLRAERQGLIEHVGRESNRESRGVVLVWDLTERKKREVA